MIVVRLPANRLAEVRLAPSPTVEILAWLRRTVDRTPHPLFGDPGPAARCAVHDPDVALVAQVVRGAAGYVPDLFTPKPPGSTWSQALGSQLDVVRETTDEAIGAQLDFAQSGRTRLPVNVRRAIDSGTFARRAAGGLYTFWRAVLADDWRQIDETLTADIRRRAQVTASHGIGRMLDTLDRRLRWHGDRLQISSRFDEEAGPPAGDLVLAPSVFGWSRLSVQVCDPVNAVIVYPAYWPGDGRGSPVGSLAGLVGPSRAAILASLDAPRTTTALSRGHRLAPSTVSHHLGVLFAAGLVIKVRDGVLVHYVRTERGDALVEYDIRCSSNS